MELNVLIAAGDEAKAQELKQSLMDLAAKTDIEKIHFYKNTTEGVSERMEPELWKKFQLALVDLSRRDAKLTGELLYRNNPACRLIYFGEEREPGERLRLALPSRPVWYWDERDKADLEQLFKAQLGQIKTDPYIFYYGDRLRSLAIPYEQISCIYSQKRAVYLRTEQGELGPIPRTLNQVAATLPEAMFLRVHQSFLVRKDCIRSFARGERILTLADGFEVPVSRAQYDVVCRWFDQNDSLGR